MKALDSKLENHPRHSHTKAEILRRKYSLALVGLLISAPVRQSIFNNSSTAVKTGIKRRVAIQLVSVKIDAAERPLKSDVR